MMKSYDLIIVGAGPAGSTLARLAGTERSVLLLDGQFRNKPCGGLLAPDAQKALARFGLTLPKDVLVDPQIFSVKTIDVPTGLIRWYPRTYLNVDRRRFDAWLLDLAAEHSEVISARLRRVEKVGEMYCVRFSAPGGEMQTACAPVIVGADGAGSLVRRSLFPALRTRTYVSVQQWFHEDSSRVNPFYSCIFDPQATDCCAWSIHKDGQMLFGGAYRPHGCRKAFEEQKQRLARFGFDFGTPEKTEACLVLRPTGPRSFCCGKENAYLIGEAAGFISPSSLEGISSAILSASALYESLNDAHPLHTYRRRTLSLRMKLLFKRLKCPFMYWPFLRTLVMRSGLSALDVKTE